MNTNRVHFIWREPQALQGFRTGVCLHGHTMHSQECLSFLPRYLHRVPVISQVVGRYQHPRSASDAVDFSRAHWTPPLAPAAAMQLECDQIAKLGLQPLVSLTDHDDIEAGMALRVTGPPDEVPVSVEWTVPYEESVLHLGIHNLPAGEERAWTQTMAQYTAGPNAAALPGLLRRLSEIPETLIVLNHPFWLEEGVEEEGHRRSLCRLFRECLEWIHAFELNGTRIWKENAATMTLARVHRRSLVSGGDRHACEPGASLNLTNAQSFSEFASEIRQGKSTLLFMPQYREPMPLRVLEASWDILRPYPEYPGRERWTDRVFYTGADGIARAVSEVWKNEVPWMLGSAAGLLQLCATTPLRSAVRLLLMEKGEALP